MLILIFLLLFLVPCFVLCRFLPDNFFFVVRLHARMTCMLLPLLLARKGRILYSHSHAFSANRSGTRRPFKQCCRFCISSIGSLAVRSTEILLPTLVGRRSNSSFSASRYSCLKMLSQLQPKVNMWLGRIVHVRGSRQ